MNLALQNVIDTLLQLRQQGVDPDTPVRICYDSGAATRDVEMISWNPNDPDPGVVISD